MHISDVVIIVTIDQFIMFVINRDRFERFNTVHGEDVVSTVGVSQSVNPALTNTCTVRPHTGYHNIQ